MALAPRPSSSVMPSYPAQLLADVMGGLDRAVTFTGNPRPLFADLVHCRVVILRHLVSGDKWIENNNVDVVLFNELDDPVYDRLNNEIAGHWVVPGYNN